MKKIKYAVFLQLLLLLVSCNAQENKNTQTILIKDAWVREVPGGSEITAGYMTLENLTGSDDRLIEVNCDLAKNTEIHRSYIDENDIAHMEQVKSVQIPSKERVELSPGGYHLMLMGVDKNLNSKEKVKLELNFEKSGKKIIDVEVRGF